MTPREFIRCVRGRGADLHLVRRGVSGSALCGLLLEEEEAYAVGHRAEVAQYLKLEERAHACVLEIRAGRPCILPINGLSEPVITLLDGAPDDFERDAFTEGLEVWRMSELRELHKLPVAKRELVAEVRRVFEGVLLPSSDEGVPDGPEA